MSAAAHGGGVGGVGGGSFAAFASLIADSLSLHEPSRSAADVARSVSDSVQQLRVRMHKQKGQAQQTARRQAAAAQQAQRKKRTPPWLIDALPAGVLHRPWHADDRQQLSALLRSADPSVCKCAPARRRAALEEDPAACCCLTRLVHLSQALDRPLADVAQRLQLHAQLGPFEPALPADPTPAAEPVPHHSADDVAARWAAHLHDDSLVGVSQLDWTLGAGPVPAVPSARPHVPWSEARMHELMELVRDQRVRMLERVRRARLADAAAAVAAGDEAAEEPQPDDEPVPHLMASDWAVVAEQLQPPAHPDTARARYFAAMKSGGAVVPADCATHPPLYFPTRERYERQLFFDRSTAAQRRRDDAEDEAERAEAGEARDGADDGKDGDADGDGGSVTRSDDDDHGLSSRRGKRKRSKTAATHHAPSNADVLRAVRRLSKRYRA